MTQEELRRANRAAREEARCQREQVRKARLRVIACVAALLLIGTTASFGHLVFGRTEAANGHTVSIEADGAVGQASAPNEDELRIREAVEAGAVAGDPNIGYLPTPLVAECNGIVLHSPISVNNITEIEFHQASFNTALQLSSLVTIVEAQDAADQHGTRHIPPAEQPRGNRAMIAEAVSTWRLDSVGPEMSAVDVGALAGTDVYAPVTGTVVKIKTYSLFGQIDDYEIHIQSPEHPELDIVMLHVENLSVKVGDTVQGGSTRMARVRNIGEVIDNNLANFTAPGDPGNHCHVQVNDASREDYQGLEGAINIFR
jgi:biotin carboxyl carrier protein